MKHMKKLFAILLVTLMIGSLMGCGAEDVTYYTRDASKRTSGERTRPTYPDDIRTTTKATKEADPTRSQAAPSESKEPSSQAGPEFPDKVEIKGAKYVMIYNPYFFDEQDALVSNNAKRNTGAIGSQIMIGMNRADGIDGLELPVMLSQDELGDGLQDLEIEEGGRAGGLAKVYKKGDVQAFYAYTDSNLSKRGLRNFTCIYEGKHCYIWDLDGKVTASQAKDLGKEFDEKIYAKDTETFGQGRFTEDGGKVHILFQPLRKGLGGFFTMYDIFATGEVTASEIKTYGLNVDHAIININSSMLNTDYDFIRSTLAHEFQHQICATDYVEYNKQQMRTWLNEAMSAYAEDLIYPGIKNEGLYQVLMFMSDPFRKGQSLYNFSTQYDDYIGAYGAVYMFTQYMKELAGDKVFTNVHQNYRTGRKGMTEAEIIFKSVSSKVQDQIDRKYTYPKFIEKEFETEEELWMSKLTLDFFLASLQMNLGGSKSYGYSAQQIWDLGHKQMFYSEINPRDIEGGGRMIVALEGDTFTIPKDAQKGLIYVGLDKDFKPVTGVFTAAGEN